MGYQIIGDSCCDINEVLSRKVNVTHVPLFLNIGSETIVDNGEIGTLSLLEKMRASSQGATTACPAPGAFAEAYAKEENSFAITISSRLSGSHGSAQVGREIALEQDGTKNIHVFDSKSASAGETLIAIRIQELIDKGLGFQEIVSKVEEFIKSMKTMFVLECLDNLVKTGRLNKVAGLVSSTLHLSPIMKGVDGVIEAEEKVIGNKKALRKLGDKICDINEKLRHDILVIAHCNCREKAEKLKAEVQAKCQLFKEIHIVPTGGLSTVYAHDGGVIVAF